MHFPFHHFPAGEPQTPLEGGEGMLSIPFGRRSSKVQICSDLPQIAQFWRKTGFLSPKAGQVLSWNRWRLRYLHLNWLYQQGGQFKRHALRSSCWGQGKSPKDPHSEPERQARPWQCCGEKEQGLCPSPGTAHLLGFTQPQVSFDNPGQVLFSLTVLRE